MMLLMVPTPFASRTFNDTSGTRPMPTFSPFESGRCHDNAGDVAAMPVVVVGQWAVDEVDEATR